MIEIKIIHGKEIHIILAKGHATGSVEVCAAVSTLLQTLAGFCARPPHPALAHFEKGLAVVGLRREQEAYLQMCLFGLFSLAHDYPDLITISEETFSG